MQQISLTTLLEAGCHFGHKLDRWHPKASVFIYGPKEGIHIIDLAKTRDGLNSAANYIKQLAQDGKSVLVVATKRQAKGVVADKAKEAGVFYLTNRWIGGFLTNFEEVKKNIEKLNKMKKEEESGEWNKFPKHERIELEKEMRKLEIVYGGVKDLLKLPDCVYIVDIRKEYNAVKEARRRGIPIVAIVDTNSDPNQVDYVIPANDDAVGSIKLITDYILDSYKEGKGMREKKEAEGKRTPEEMAKEMENAGMENAKIKSEEKVDKLEKVKEKEAVEIKDKKIKVKKRGRPKKAK
ncbi:30S ribosomal protein S2 [Candidatus Gottesmanbacteria bacterium]|nr:30S ribosomal protein S2 [Candidatus Gottesmanbacteria bacterium]